MLYVYIHTLQIIYIYKYNKGFVLVFCVVWIWASACVAWKREQRRATSPHNPCIRTKGS